MTQVLKQWRSASACDTARSEVQMDTRLKIFTRSLAHAELLRVRDNSCQNKGTTSNELSVHKYVQPQKKKKNRHII